MRKLFRRLKFKKQIYRSITMKSRCEKRDSRKKIKGKQKEKELW